MSAYAARLRAMPRSVAVTAAVLAAAVVAWIVTVERMQGMDGGPGTDLGGLGWYVGIWVTMMAAMMLPSAAPMVLVFARVRRGGWVFMSAGYLAAWTLYGLLAYSVYRGIRALDLGFLDWDEQGPIAAGVVVALAGLYQLTPLKEVCLRHCRSPLHFVLHGFKRGRTGAVRMGVEHGFYCLGCCWGLMIALFAVGVMSILWMAVIGGVIFAEKVVFGARLTRTLAVLLVAAGIWIAAAPGSVPGLTEPRVPPAMTRMEDMQTKPQTGSTKRPGMPSQTGMMRKSGDGMETTP